MKVSLDWLNDYVTTKLSPDKLAEQFTLTGSEVEQVEKIQTVDHKVIVGEIKTIVKHPHANKLQVAKVDIGKDRVFDIVCGAPNIKPGQKVPVAQVGAKLPNGMIIEAAVIRGFKSLGMLCAEDELGLGSGHTGILILDEDIEVGLPLNKAIGTGDSILHFALTPNRADCFSLVGLAREVAAFTGVKMKLPKPEFKESGIATTKHVRVTMREPKLCSRYMARYVTQVNVGPSPLWLKTRLRKSGIKSINNVVDSTNYVMLELGQPLHAFDASLVSNQSIVVRRARKGEKIMTLDEKEETLDSTMLVIADTKKPTAIAGVMGGQHSGIRSSTKTIILESAIFDPLSVRLTSQKLGLRSESSNRFEKGVDPGLTLLALDRAAQLLQELAGGTIAAGYIDTGKVQPKSTSVIVTREQVNSLLNTKLTTAVMKTYLVNLGFEVEATAEQLVVTVPSWRQDVSLAEDVIEEISRLYGYNKLKPTRMRAVLSPVGLPPTRQLERRLKDLLVGKGLIELLTYSYYSEVEKTTAATKLTHLELANPLSQEQKYLRTSLIPHMLNALKRATRDFVGVFEIGNVFGARPKQQLPLEKKLLTIGYRVRQGKVSGLPENRLQYRWLKSIAESIFNSLGIKGITYKLEAETGWLVTVAVKKGSDILGYLRITKFSKQPKHLYAFVEFNHGMLERLQREPHSADFPKYPLVERDIAFWLGYEYSWAQVQTKLLEVDELISQVALFDIYGDEQHTKQRSLAVRVSLQASDRTLKEREIEPVFKAIAGQLKDTFKAKIRD